MQKVGFIILIVSTFSELLLARDVKIEVACERRIEKGFIKLVDINIFTKNVNHCDWLKTDLNIL